jgi:hypothetical protein
MKLLMLVIISTFPILAHGTEDAETRRQRFEKQCEVERKRRDENMARQETAAARQAQKSVAAKPMQEPASVKETAAEASPPRYAGRQLELREVFPTGILFFLFCIIPTTLFLLAMPRDDGHGRPIFFFAFLLYMALWATKYGIINVMCTIGATTFCGGIILIALLVVFYPVYSLIFAVFK